MTDREVSDRLVEVVGPTLAQGPATRTDLLTAAVSARAPTPVIQALLELPERRYRDIGDVVPHLPA